MDTVDLNFGLIFTKLDNWLDGFIRLLPNLIVAMIVLAVFWSLSRVVNSLIRRAATRRDRPSLGEVGGSLLSWVVLILGFLLSATIVLPSVSPGDLIAGLGVSSVAIGFAFKDILQNLLAGILILIRQPFSIGDQIISGGHEGTVERIETRATILKTYDGRRVVIPNADIYTESVVVNTAFPARRSEYDVGVGSEDDWTQARQVMERACASVQGVKADPAPETVPVDIGDFANIIRLRWWTNSDQSTQTHVKGEVIQSVQKALAEAGIDTPYPTQVHLFHDQTEDDDT